MSLDDLLLLVLALVVAAEFALITRAKPLIGLWAMMLAALLSYWGVPDAVVLLGYQVYPLDLVALVLLAVVVDRWISGFATHAALVVLLALLGLALLRGMPLFGGAATVNASREMLYLLIAAAFASTARLSWRDVELAWMASSAVLVISAAVFWTRNGFGTYATDGSRALNAAQSLIVAQTAVLVLGRRGGRATTLTAVLLFVVLLLSQQRTAWATTVIMVAVLAYRRADQSEGRVRRRARLFLTAGAVAVAGLLAIGPSGLRAGISTATSTISTDSGTFGWRVEGWIALYDRFRSGTSLDQMIGQLAGAGFARTIRGNLVTVSPHNMYLTVLISLGLAGLTAFLYLLAQATRRASRQPTAVHAVILGMWVYSIGYQIPATSGLLLGLALAGETSISRRELRGRESMSPTSMAAAIPDLARTGEQR